MTFLFRSKIFSTGMFIVFSFLFLSAMGQPSEVGSISEHRQEFRFRPGVQHGSGQVVNALLQLASEGGQKLRVYTTYSLSSQVLLRPDEGGDKLALSFQSMNVEGDTKYGDFSLVPWMLPGLADIEIVARQKNGNGVQHFEFRNVALTWPQMLNDAVLLNLNGQRADAFAGFSIKRIHFHYAESHLGEIDFLLEALSAYYRAPEQLEKAQALIFELDQTRVEDLILEEFRLCEAEVIASRLSHSPFLQLIQKTGSDPLGNTQKLVLLQNQLTALREWYNIRIAHIDSILFERGEELLRQGLQAESRVIFERVLVFNPQHIPAHSQIAQMDMGLGRTQEVMLRIRGFMGRVGAPAIWKEEAVAITQKLFFAEIARAEDLAEDGRYLDARTVLERLQDFCNDLVQWSCPAELLESLTRVHYGMYRSYLSVARRAFANGNLSFAITYGESALEYQQQYQSFIPDASEVWMLFQSVVDSYRQQAMQAGMFHDYSTMAVALEQALNLCSKYAALQCPAALAEHKEEAVRARDQARQIVVEYVVTQPLVTRPAITAEAAAQQVRQLLSEGHLRAWAGETEQARDLLNEITEFALRYDLRRDTLINARIVSLGNMIRTRECEMEIQRGDRLWEEIKERIARGFYLEAEASYRELITLNEGMGRCNFDFSPAIKELTHVEKLAGYQQLINDAQAAYFRGAQTGFDIFLVKYRRAETYAQEEQLHLRGLRHIPLADFVSGSSNSSLVKAAVRFFADENHHALALKMLHVLKNERIDAREARPLQEYAAKQAALFMRTEQPAANPRSLARELTQNDPWFRYYARAFEGAFSR